MQVTVQHFNNPSDIMSIGHFNVTLERQSRNGTIERHTIGSNVDHSLSAAIKADLKKDPGSHGPLGHLVAGYYQTLETATAIFSSKGGVLQVEPIGEFYKGDPVTSFSWQVADRFAGEFDRLFGFFNEIAAKGKIPHDWDLNGFLQDGLNCGEFALTVTERLGVDLLSGFPLNELNSSIAGGQIINHQIRSSFANNGLTPSHAAEHWTSVKKALLYAARLDKVGIITTAEISKLVEHLKTPMVDGMGQFYTTHLAYRFAGANFVEHCFAAGTMIELWDGSEKPIEEIRANDIVVSIDEHGARVPGRVSRTFENEATILLDVHGLRVTPGHVTLCGDGRFDGRYVPMIDILRSDGALVTAHGEKIRAATNCRVGGPNDRFVWVAAGEHQADGSIVLSDKGRIRVGTRVITPDGRDVSLADLIAAAGGVLSDDGLVTLPERGVAGAFHWPFGETLPKPEDYVLQRSQTSLWAIYEADEWEAIDPQTPAPTLADSGLSASGQPMGGQLAEANVLLHTSTAVSWGAGDAPSGTAQRGDWSRAPRSSVN